MGFLGDFFVMGVRFRGSLLGERFWYDVERVLNEWVLPVQIGS